MPGQPNHGAPKIRLSNRYTARAIINLSHQVIAVWNLSRAGVREQVAMRITGHKTASMYRRYRIVDERDLREATENLQAYLATQPKTAVVVPLKKVTSE